MTMASSLVVFLPLLLVLVAVCPYAAGGGGACRYTRLFSLGDSYTDTGNLVSLTPNGSVLKPPYGETFFGRPAGRFCDGRLIVDFIAEALKLPFLTPYLVGKTAEDFRAGANMAVSSQTALSRQVFKDMGLDLTKLPPLLFSLDVQLEWLKLALHRVAPTGPERQDMMSSSLFLLGEIGFNDYNHPFFQNRPFTEIRPLLPQVIKKIEEATKVLIGLGAKTIVVPGVIPMGCVPRYLHVFQSSSKPGDYDATGCIRWLNDFAEEHNRALTRMLDRIRAREPTVAVVYADYYGAVMEITRNPQEHGFTKDAALLTACCGDSSKLLACNATAVLCPDPSKHISWDGIHLTEAAYHFVARGVLDGPYAAPSSIRSKCRRR